MVETSPSPDRKLTRRFATYDADHDGYIGPADFALAAHAMGSAFNLAPDAPPRVRLVESLLAVWNRLVAAADGDDDGRISYAEYRDAFAAGLLETPESFEAAYGPFIDAVMDIADGDGDGSLLREEHIRWTGSLMGVPEEVAGEVFDRLDHDGDGLVSRTRLLDALREHYFDEDPRSADGRLLAPLDP